MTVKPIPAGYHTITPYLVVQGAAQLIEFLKQAFDAEEILRMAQPDGTIMHAEVKNGPILTHSKHISGGRRRGLVKILVMGVRNR